MKTPPISSTLFLLSILPLLTSCQSADDLEDLVERSVDVDGVWRVETDRGYKASNTLIRIATGPQSRLDPSRHQLNGRFLTQATCTYAPGVEVDSFFDARTGMSKILDSPETYLISGYMAFCPSEFFRDSCTNIPGHDGVIFEPFDTDKVGTWMIRGTYQSFRLQVTGAGTCEVTDTIKNNFRLVRASCPLNRTKAVPEGEEIGEKEYRDFLRDMVKEGISEAGGGPVVTIGDGIEQIDAARCMPEELITAINDMKHNPQNFPKCNEFCGAWSDWVSSISNRGKKKEMTDCMGECSKKPL